ncbi:MAG: oligoribonuclease [bacterium]|jgi:oligoribonuclease|nr:oligoribonuclease [bacterium]
MKKDKYYIPKKLLWLDLEMTGLDPEKDVILEVAVEITDLDFKTLDTYEAIVRQPQTKVVDRMNKNPFWAEFSENRDEFLKKISTAKTPSEVEKDLIEITEKHFGSEAAILSGNSIHSDRLFISKHWPEFNLKLHYRMLDVSSFKLIMQSKYKIFFEKNEAHRAFDDVQASIAELQHYLEYFKEN